MVASARADFSRRRRKREALLRRGDAQVVGHGEMIESVSEPALKAMRSFVRRASSRSRRAREHKRRERRQGASIPAKSLLTEMRLEKRPQSLASPMQPSFYRSRGCPQNFGRLFGAEFLDVAE
jgi:hypothetical protein